MLTRKAAVETASNHLTELVPIVGAPILEEYYFTDGIWNVTLSYQPGLPASANGTSGSPSGHRDFKAFAIDGRSGEVLSMKIRATRA